MLKDSPMRAELALLIEAKKKGNYKLNLRIYLIFKILELKEIKEKYGEKEVGRYTVN